MENKKGLIITIAVVTVILLGAIGYYFYAKANADVSQDSVCRSLTGNAWRNCAINAKKWQLFLRDTSEANFVKVLEGMKTGAGIVTPTKIKPSQKVTFTVTPATVKWRDQVTLSWTLENVASCKPSGAPNVPGWADNDRLKEITKTNAYSGIVVTEDTTFVLTCTGTDGIVKSYNAPVTVDGDTDHNPQPAQNVDFSADQAIGAPAGEWTVSWVLENVNNCILNNSVTERTVTETGSEGVTVTKTTPYTLTCIGIDGASAKYSISVTYPDDITTEMDGATLELKDAVGTPLVGATVDAFIYTGQNYGTAMKVLALQKKAGVTDANGIYNISAAELEAVKNTAAQSSYAPLWCNETSQSVSDDFYINYQITTSDGIVYYDSYEVNISRLDGVVGANEETVASWGADTSIELMCSENSFDYATKYVAGTPTTSIINLSILVDTSEQ